MPYHHFNADLVKERVICWIQDWFAQNGPESCAVIGISGGKDSAVVAALCVAALGRERVLGVQMPCGTQADIADADKVIDFLGIRSYQVNIGNARQAVQDAVTSAGVPASPQAQLNLPARLRMATLFAVAQSVNGRVSCNCNLSEDYIGYSTFGGDDFGSFAPLRSFTTDEVVALGYALGYPADIIEKTPMDGLCGKTDEENMGFSYAVLNKYIRTGICEDAATKARIDELHARNLFKMRLAPFYDHMSDKK